MWRSDRARWSGWAEKCVPTDFTCVCPFRSRPTRGDCRAGGNFAFRKFVREKRGKKQFSGTWRFLGISTARCQALGAHTHFVFVWTVEVLSTRGHLCHRQWCNVWCFVGNVVLWCSLSPSLSPSRSLCGISRRWRDARRLCVGGEFYVVLLPLFSGPRHFRYPRRPVTSAFRFVCFFKTANGVNAVFLRMFTGRT